MKTLVSLNTLEQFTIGQLRQITERCADNIPLWFIDESGERRVAHVRLDGDGIRFELEERG